eukprot:jgi/Orpsp1_1/1177951/evm.model.c7180000063480.1
MEDRNRSTKMILGEPGSIFKIWDDELFNILCELDLEKYIESQVIQTEEVSKISENNIKKYKFVKGDRTRVYVLSTNEDDIKNDIKVKNIILDKAISDEHTHSDNERIGILENELEDLIFNENNTGMSLFISSMNNKFTELKSLGINKTDREKFDYLHNAIPEKLVFSSNLFLYQDNWKKCCSVIIDTYQHTREL